MTLETVPADQFASVGVELVPPRSQVAVAALSLLAFVTKVTDWTAFLANQKFVVRVLRRADGRELIRYEYAKGREANSHAESLRRRLPSWDVADLCAHLGVSRAEALENPPIANS